MDILESVNNNIASVFKGYKYRLISEFMVNVDGVRTKVSMPTTSGKILSVEKYMISGLEQIQYSGNIEDLIRDKAVGLLYSMKREAAKEDTELVEEEVK